MNCAKWTGGSPGSVPSDSLRTSASAPPVGATPAPIPDGGTLCRPPVPSMQPPSRMGSSGRRLSRRLSRHVAPADSSLRSTASQAGNRLRARSPTLQSTRRRKHRRTSGDRRPRRPSTRPAIPCATRPDSSRCNETPRTLPRPSRPGPTYTCPARVAGHAADSAGRWPPEPASPSADSLQTYDPPLVRRSQSAYDDSCRQRSLMECRKIPRAPRSARRSGDDIPIGAAMS